MVIENFLKRSQGAMEFLILFGAVMFFFVAFLLVIQGNIQEKNLERQKVLAQDLALSVQNEISLASESSDGYYREFYIPENLLGNYYEIEIVEDRVYIHGDRIGISYKIFPIYGSIMKGVNSIKKENGSVYLN